MERNSILEPVLRELSISRSSRQKTYFHWFNYWKKLSSWSWITRFSPILFVPWYYIVFSNFVTAFWQVNFMEGNENTSVLSQHFQSHLDEKKRRNRPSIYASRIYSKTSFKFVTQTTSSMQRAMADVRGSRSSQSNPIVDIDTDGAWNVRERFSTITRSSATWPLWECSEFGNRLSKRFKSFHHANETPFFQTIMWKFR